jgi:cysteine desulfurase
MENIYLDYAASTPVDPLVVKEMALYYNDIYGNPSSIHQQGQSAKEAIDEARDKVARLIGAKTSEIVFTGGGSEANNFALKGIALSYKNKGNHIITSDIEHPSVANTCKSLEISGCRVTFIPVNEYGMVNPDDINKAITPETILISIMHANNEIGTIQPLAEIAGIARDKEVLLHTDAVQTTGHIELDVEKMGIDMLSISAHKLYGPKGVGALYIRSGVNITPLIHGGGQENGHRSGTENIAGIAGFGKAAELAKEELNDEIIRQTGLRNYLIQELTRRIANIKLNGHPERRLPNNTNISIDGINGADLLLSLDSKGIYISTGSACIALDSEPSHILTAIGLSPAMARSALRLTIGRWTTREQIDRVIEILSETVNHLLSINHGGQQ